MKEELISFETAKLAKERGFDWNCSDFFNIRGLLFSNGWCEDIYDKFQEPFLVNNTALENTKLTHITRPTQSLLQKWLRDVQNIHIVIEPWNPENEEYNVTVYARQLSLDGNEFGDSTWENNKSYEEALEKGLQEALKLIK